MKLRRKNNSTNDLTNIRNILNNTLFTLDNYMIKMLKLENINLQLKSEEELVNFAYSISEKVQEFLFDVKILHFANSYDISQKLELEDQFIRRATKFSKKILLREYKNMLIDETIENNISDIQTIIIIWKKIVDNSSIQELNKKVDNIKNAFLTANNPIFELDSNAIIKLCNFYNNNISTSFVNDNSFMLFSSLDERS